MSFLLDALRKSERQRRLGETPRIQVPVLGQSGRKPQRPRKLLLALGLVVIALLSWLLFLQNSADQDSISTADAPTGPAGGAAADSTAAAPATANPPAQTAANPAATSPAGDRPATPQPATPQPGTVAAADNSLPSALSESNQEQPLGDINELAERIAEREAQARAEQLRQTQLLAEQARAEQARAAEQEQQKQQLEQQLAEIPAAQDGADDAAATPAADNTDNAADEWAPERPAHISYFELPVNVRQNLPDLAISIRVYDNVPENRFVIIKGERVLEGDDIPGSEGVKLVEVRRQSLILEYQDYVFEYQ